MAGKTRVRGLEIEAETRINDFNFSFGYLLANAKFADFPSNQNIVGLRIPQVPLHQFHFSNKVWRIKMVGVFHFKDVPHLSNSIMI